MSECLWWADSQLALQLEEKRHLRMLRPLLTSAHAAQLACDTGWIMTVNNDIISLTGFSISQRLSFVKLKDCFSEVRRTHGGNCCNRKNLACINEAMSLQTYQAKWTADMLGPGLFKILTHLLPRERLLYRSESGSFIIDRNRKRDNYS